MAPNIRRAAGTQTFFDVLKVWSGIKRPNPEQDLEDFAAGVTLVVSCFLRPLADTAARSPLGMLHLTQGQPVTWQRSRKEPVALRPPLTLADAGEKANQPTLAALTLVSASGSFSVQIPKLDLELVKHALAAQASSPRVPLPDHEDGGQRDQQDH